MMTVYGIRQCDTCRKALKTLESQGVEHRFHDLRADGLAPALVKSWLESPHADVLVNRRSTTWRGLSDADKASTGKDLQALLLAHPTLIKRPVYMEGDTLLGIGKLD